MCSTSLIFMHSENLGQSENCSLIGKTLPGILYLKRLYSDCTQVFRLLHFTTKAEAHLSDILSHKFSFREIYYLLRSSSHSLHELQW